MVIAAQAKAIEELTAANAWLVERIAALERIVGRRRIIAELLAATVS